MNIKIAGIDVHPCLSPENDQWYFEALIHGHFKNKRPVRSIFGCAFSCIAASGFSTPEAPDKTSCWFQPFFNQLKKCGSSIGIMLLGLCEKSNMLTNIHQRGHHWYLYYYSASYICMTHTHIPFLDGLFTSQTRNLEVLLLWRTTRAPVWTPGPGASFAPPLLFGYLPAVQTSPWSTEFDVRIESFGQWQKYQTVQNFRNLILCALTWIHLGGFGGYSNGLMCQFSVSSK